MIEDVAIKHLERAKLLSDIGRFREAIHELHQFLRTAPDDYDALCEIALCHLNLDESNFVIQYTNQAIKIAPENEWAYRLQSYAQLSLGNNRMALEKAQTAAAKAPYFIYSLQTLANAQISSFQLEEANETAQRLLKLAPEDEGTHEICGQIALKEENWKKAEFHFQYILKLNPNSFSAMNNLGKTYLDLSQTGWRFAERKLYRQKAVNYFEQAVKISPAATLAQDNLKIAQKSKIFNYKLKINWFWLVFSLFGLLKISVILIGVGIALLQLFTPYSKNVLVFAANIYFLVFISLLFLLICVYLFTADILAKWEDFLQYQIKNNLLISILSVFTFPMIINLIIIYFNFQQTNLLIFLAEIFYLAAHIWVLYRIFKNQRIKND